MIFISDYVRVRLTVAWLVPIVEQELPTLPENLSSPPVFSGVRVAQSLVFCVVLCGWFFVLLFCFSVAIVCSVLVPFTATDYPFGMFALVLNNIITFHWSVSYLGQCAKFFSLTITVREHRKSNQELTIQRHRQHRTQCTERRHTNHSWGWTQVYTMGKQPCLDTRRVTRIVRSAALFRHSPCYSYCLVSSPF